MSSDAQQDPLTLLRVSIQTNTPPILSTSTTPPPSSLPPIPLHVATHLIFRPPHSQQQPIALPLSTPTRFVKKEGEASPPGPVDLRSIYFAWLNRELGIPEYVNLAQTFDAQKPGGGVAAGAGIKNLNFVERLELVGWLEGVQEESEFIQPVAVAQAKRDGGVAVGGVGGAAGAGAGGAGAGQSAGGMVVGRGRGEVLSGQAQNGAVQGQVSGPRPPRQIDARLAEIYSHERVVVNRNTALRGSKPMDFSYVRKHTEDFVSRLKSSTNPTGTPGSHLKSNNLLSTPNSKSASTTTATPTTALSTTTSTPSKPSSSSRSYPIILLSPSASALLTMSNVKPFLETGTFIPPHQLSTTATSTTTPQMIDISRILPSIHPTTPQRFIVVDSPEKFKPEYWSRVVAVFTTGQTWQFKSYKWHQPQELFRHVKGFYVGWEGEQVPEMVRGWGAGVTCVNVERGRRFRDREVCEVLWMEIERWMVAVGWGSSGGGAGGQVGRG